MSLVPKELKYTKTHEWIKVVGDTALIGITDFAQGELSDIVFVELHPVGKQLKQNDPFGTVEAVKAVSDVYSPVSGEVIAINEDLKNDPATVNKDPYGKGWMMKIKLANLAEVNGLLKPADYEVLAAKSAH
jgi:glycine cleavage system H protein